jgi:type II secretory pathway component PulF
LAVLLQNDVPLAEAVALASGAIGSARLATAGQALSERLARGHVAGPVPPGFPPVVATMLLAGHSQPRLVRSLLRTAEVYREEASRRSQWLALYVPVVLVIGICGGVVLLYALLALGPWLMILRGISRMG